MEEKNCLARLSRAEHPYMLRMLDTAKDDASLYFMLRPVLGGSLHKHATRRVSDSALNLSIGAVRGYAAEVVSALRFLTAHGIVHRDIKLNNLLLNDRGHAVLCDFSSAKMLYPNDYHASVLEIAPEAAARTFTVTGSLHNMAPEMAAESCGHSFPVDWWALGVLIHELLTGEGFPWGERDAATRRTSALLALGQDQDHDWAEGKGERWAGRPNPWEWSAIEPPLALLPCYTSADSNHGRGLAARDLVGRLLAVRPEQRLPHTCLQDALADLEAHAFFDGVNWAAVHEGTSPAPWPDFDRRLGFLELLAPAAANEPVVTTEQQAMFEGF